MQINHTWRQKKKKICGNQTKILNKGDGFFAQPNIEHGVVCLDEGILIDSFTPYREDFM